VNLPFMTSACSSRVCSVTVLEGLSSEPVSTWLPKFQAYDDELVSRYGLPNERLETLPGARDTAAALPACVASRAVIYRTTWVWENSTGIVLALMNDKLGPLIEISYMSPASARSNQAEGL
jgi:hypothetical protein